MGIKNYYFQIIEVLIIALSKLLHKIMPMKPPIVPIEPPLFLHEDEFISKIITQDWQEFSPFITQNIIRNFAIYPHLNPNYQIYFWAKIGSFYGQKLDFGHHHFIKNLACQFINIITNPNLHPQDYQFLARAQKILKIWQFFAINPADNLYCQCALAFDALSSGRNIRPNLRRIAKLCENFLLPDGGIASGSVYEISEICNYLTSLYENTMANHQIFSDEIKESLKQVSSVILTLSNHEGSLPYHTSPIIPRKILQKMHKSIGKAQTATHSLPNMGYYRIESGDFMVICDTHEYRRHAKHAHASFSSMELHYHQYSVFGGLGFWDHDESRLSAAHSMLVVENKNILPLNGKYMENMMQPFVKRSVKNDSESLFLSHFAYKNKFGLTIERTISIMKSPNCIYGKDKLIGTGSRNFAIYFHLHPDCKINETAKKNMMLIMLKNGNGLYFTIENAEIIHHKSIYGTIDGMRTTTCIMVKGETVAGETIIDWQLRPA